ncbi:MAG: hypothetical protein OEU36_23255 [Gammaproteobacteria bacterium]|nr:hypothetical protein [Gammaproteobacteria bacterium]
MPTSAKPDSVPHCYVVDAATLAFLSQRSNFKGTIQLGIHGAVLIIAASVVSTTQIDYR